MNYDPSKDDKLCKCGHIYYTHVDPQGNTNPVGCKLCNCGGFSEMETWTLTFVDYDSCNRPVYSDGTTLYVDVNPRNGFRPELCTKVNNELDGEPDIPLTEKVRIEFVPERIVWHRRLTKKCAWCGIIEDDHHIVNHPFHEPEE